MAEAQGTLARIEGTFTSPVGKAMLLGGLVLALQIPVLGIWELVGERDARRGEVQAEVSSKWGGVQDLVAPYLVVPVRRTIMEPTLDGPRPREVAGTATFLPRDLSIEGRLETEVRHRGIFEVPVYRVALDVWGAFAPIDAVALEEDARIDWDEAQLVLEISDPRGIEAGVRARWGDAELELQPGPGLAPAGRPGIHVPVEVDPAAGREVSIQLDLRGSRQLRFAPLGERTRVRLSGAWPDPSFQGAWLPRSHSISPDGFGADWEIPFLGRNFPQQWEAAPHTGAIEASLFGVDLYTPVDAYRATERSLKYQILFLALTFAVIWLIEVRAGARVHVIQYGLIGAALCVFYLLELALAEHLGLAPAYALGALAVASLVFYYALGVLETRRRALSIAGLISGLYAYLYALLQIADYALLAGALGVFAALAAITVATRQVDWYALSRRGEPGR